VSDVNTAFLEGRWALDARAGVTNKALPTKSHKRRALGVSTATVVSLTCTKDSSTDSSLSCFWANSIPADFYINVNFHGSETKRVVS